MSSMSAPDGVQLPGASRVTSPMKSPLDRCTVKPQSAGQRRKSASMRSPMRRSWGLTPSPRTKGEQQEHAQRDRAGARCERHVDRLSFLDLDDDRPDFRAVRVARVGEPAIGETRRSSRDENNASQPCDTHRRMIRPRASALCAKAHRARRNRPLACGMTPGLTLKKEPVPRNAQGGWKHRLPRLQYAYDALEPHIDERTMAMHHGELHATYVAQLNTV